ncbi:hypothetical protein [Lichenicoccus sp.]|uniref:hypothetical protein n=1 Tax=Lichenicoccus sp. TaxID=2781899 RepID=UPI003D0BA72B
MLLAGSLWFRLHPNAAALHRDKVAGLEASLSAPEIKLEAAEALRGLIDSVTLTPDPGAADGLRIELRGALATILALASAARGPTKNSPRLVARGVNDWWLRGQDLNL